MEITMQNIYNYCDHLYGNTFEYYSYHSLGTISPEGFLKAMLYTYEIHVFMFHCLFQENKGHIISQYLIIDNMIYYSDYFVCVFSQ